MDTRPIELAPSVAMNGATRKAVGLAALAVLAGCSSEPYVVDEHEAQAGCQEFVERRLKAPATAEFGSWNAEPDPGSANGWVVSGVVDAENSFGAKIRSTFTCRMHVSDGQWVLESVTDLK